MTILISNPTGAYRIRGRETIRTQAVVVVPLIDGWTGSSPAGLIARSRTPMVTAHVTGGHLVLTGRPERALPDLATHAYAVAVRLVRPGRTVEDVIIDIPALTPLPFTAPALTVASAVIAVQGRITRRAFPQLPIPGARLTFGGPATVPLVALVVPIGAAHAAGTTVRERVLTAGAATTATQTTLGGSLALPLASTAGITAGTILAIGDQYATVAALLGGGVVALRVPLAATVRAGSPVTLTTVGATASTTTLSRSAQPGDGVLLTAGALADSVVEIVDASATEYRTNALVADADGRWRLSGVRGVPELVITTAASGFLTAGPTTYRLTPTDPLVVDLTLST